MRKVKPFIIVNKQGRHIDGRIWKTKEKAQGHIHSIRKNNPMKTIKQVGYIGLKVKRYKPFEREVKELKQSKHFIWR